MILSMLSIVFCLFPPSAISDNLGEAVAAKVAIRAVVVANSANEAPEVLFNFLTISFYIIPHYFSFLSCSTYNIAKDMPVF